MRHAAAMARRFEVRVGAHPSYPDRANFGRVSMLIGREELRLSLSAQIESLRAIAPVSFVKPHGALYNDAHHDRALADTVIQAMLDADTAMAIVCADSSQMAASARSHGVRVLREAFADRRYEPDGSLMSRGLPGALLGVEESARQAALLARDGTVITRDGTRLPIAFDTLCIHADMDQAVERLHAVREAVRVLS